MKKINIAASLTLFLVTAAFYFFGSALPSAQAQSDTGLNARSPEADRAMAARIRKLTDRTRSRSTHSRRNRSIDTDLGGGFQNVSLARLGNDDHIEGF